MAKQKFTMWMHKNLDSEPMPGQVWLAQTNLAGQRFFEGAISLGSVEIELDVPDVDTRQAAIDQIEYQLQRERADHQVRVNLLMDKMSKLMAIGHDEVAE